MFGVERQVYYRSIKRREISVLKAEQVVAMILEIRKSMPMIGGKKLYYILKKELQTLDIGRDKFFDIMRANHLFIVPKRHYHVTTNSIHRFKKHSNLILNIDIKRPNQVWVSDITYIGNRENPRYLSLVTDAYSKRIMGHYVADNLNTESSVEALKQAIKARDNMNLPLIHHSDRGLQYCSEMYQAILIKNNILCSMTQNSDPYENAVAERINGILKQEFKIDQYDLKLDHIRMLVAESIQTYNQIRPHFSNYLLTPNEMHQQDELRMKTYKSKKKQ